MTSISDIKNVMIDGQALNINGYLDIGLIDTMEDFEHFKAIVEG